MESGPAYTLRVLGSSELSDMQPILDAAARVTGVTVQLTQTGSLTGAQTVLSGKADGAYDAIWFASDHYLLLSPGGSAKLDGTTDTMSSPVILGVRASAAHRLGWENRPVSWSDIAAAADQHLFTYAMTDPAKSNSGLSALVSVATAAAGNGAALQTDEVGSASAQIAGLFKGQQLKADSSGWLTQTFLRDLTSTQGTTVDGLVDYESELLSLNASAPAHEPLTLIYPSDGVVAATYPLSVLTSASAAAKDAYHRLAVYLRTPSVQQQIMNVTNRRPVIGGIPLSAALAQHQPYELPFPGTLATVDELIAAYDDSLRRPGRTVYVLDLSGSMRGARIASLQQAVDALAGTDTTAVGRYSSFENREQITMLPFSTTPDTPTTFELPADNAGTVLQQIRQYVNNLTANGWTAIYDSVAQAYRIIEAQHTTDPNRIESIVLLTDGENNRGMSYQDFAAFYHGLPAGAPPVFTILFGDANKAELDQVAQLTGGITFDATNQPLTTVLQQIRGYQ